MAIPHALNGAKIPNWAKLLALGASLGWVTATQVAASRTTQSNTDNKVAGIEAKIDSLHFEENLEAIHARLDLLEEHSEAIDLGSRARDARVYRALGIVDDKLDVVVPTVERLDRRNGYRR